MAWNGNAINIVNLILCLVILGLGCWDYARTKRQTPFFIGAAFGLFGVSHLITFMGLEKQLELTVVLVRTFGYLIVAATLVRMRKVKQF